MWSGSARAASVIGVRGAAGREGDDPHPVRRELRRRRARELDDTGLRRPVDGPVRAAGERDLRGGVDDDPRAAFDHAPRHRPREQHGAGEVGRDQTHQRRGVHVEERPGVRNPCVVEEHDHRAGGRRQSFHRIRIGLVVGEPFGAAQLARDAFEPLAIPVGEHHLPSVDVERPRHLAPEPSGRPGHQHPAAVEAEVPRVDAPGHHAGLGGVQGTREEAALPRRPATPPARARPGRPFPPPSRGRAAPTREAGRRPPPAARSCCPLRPRSRPRRPDAGARPAWSRARSVRRLRPRPRPRPGGHHPQHAPGGPQRRAPCLRRCRIHHRSSAGHDHPIERSGRRLRHIAFLHVLPHHLRVALQTDPRSRRPPRSAARSRRRPPSGVRLPCRGSGKARPPRPAGCSCRPVRRSLRRAPRTVAPPPRPRAASSGRCPASTAGRAASRARPASVRLRPNPSPAGSTRRAAGSGSPVPRSIARWRGPPSRSRPSRLVRPPPGSRRSLPTTIRSERTPCPSRGRCRPPGCGTRCGGCPPKTAPGTPGRGRPAWSR